MGLRACGKIIIYRCLSVVLLCDVVLKVCSKLYHEALFAHAFQHLMLRPESAVFMQTVKQKQAGGQKHQDVPYQKKLQPFFFSFPCTLQSASDKVDDGVLTVNWKFALSCRIKVPPNQINCSLGATVTSYIQSDSFYSCFCSSHTVFYSLQKHLC